MGLHYKVCLLSKNLQGTSHNPYTLAGILAGNPVYQQQNLLLLEERKEEDNKIIQNIYNFCNTDRVKKQKHFFLIFFLNGETLFILQFTTIK